MKFEIIQAMEWFVSGHKRKPFTFIDKGKIYGPWYIPVTGKMHGLLHSDGVIRHSAVNENNDFTGWYRTRELARKALREYKTKNPAK